MSSSKRLEFVTKHQSALSVAAAAVLQKLIDSGVTAQIDLAALESTKSRKMQTNKAVMSSNGTSVRIYDDDGTTLLHEFEITDNRLVRTPI